MSTREGATIFGVDRYMVAAIIIAVAFFGAYRFAEARTRADGLSGSGRPEGFAPVAAVRGSAPSGIGCACCGTTAPSADGVTGERVERAARMEGGVQRISVDLSKGYYDPNVIILEAGVPAEITFGASSGCTAQVASDALGFSEDLTSGPRTVKLPALEPGEYPFFCGMRMVFGKIIVR